MHDAQQKLTMRSRLECALCGPSAQLNWCFVYQELVVLSVHARSSSKSTP